MKKVTTCLSFPLCFVGISMISTSAFAQNSINSKVYNYYQSQRAMGMGNAFSAAADDYSAMMYNPAQLAYRKDGEIQWNVISAGISKDTLPLADDMQKASDTQGTDNDKANAVSSVLEKYYGKPVGIKISPTEFFWVRPNWGFSLIVADISAEIAIQKQVGPSLDINLIKNTSFNYGRSWAMGPDMALGALAKANHRNQFSGSYSALDLALDSKIIDFKNSKEGINFDLDVGFTWKPDFSSSPSEEKKEEDTVKTTKNKVEADMYSLSQVTAERQIAQAKEAAAEAELSGEKAKDDKAKKADKDKTEVEKAIDQAVQPVTIPETRVDAAKDVKNKDVKAAQPTDKKVEEPAPVVTAESTETVAEDEKKEVKKTKDLTFSVVLRNLLSMNYSKSTLVNKDALEGPERNERVLDVGASYDLLNTEWMNLTFNLEFKNMAHKNTSVRKSTHAGIEYTALSSYWFKPQFRVGMNQMYFTAGASINLGPIYFDFVTYGEEIGTDKAKIENRINALNFGWKF